MPSKPFFRTPSPSKNGPGREAFTIRTGSVSRRSPGLAEEPWFGSNYAVYLTQAQRYDEAIAIARYTATAQHYANAEQVLSAALLLKSTVMFQQHGGLGPTAQAQWQEAVTRVPTLEEAQSLVVPYVPEAYLLLVQENLQKLFAQHPAQKP